MWPRGPGPACRARLDSEPDRALSPRRTRARQLGSGGRAHRPGPMTGQLVRARSRAGFRRAGRITASWRHRTAGARARRLLRRPGPGLGGALLRSLRPGIVESLGADSERGLGERTRNRTRSADSEPNLEPDSIPDLERGHRVNALCPSPLLGARPPLRPPPAGRPAGSESRGRLCSDWTRFRVRRRRACWRRNGRRENARRRPASPRLEVGGLVFALRRPISIVLVIIFRGATESRRWQAPQPAVGAAAFRATRAGSVSKSPRQSLCNLCIRSESKQRYRPTLDVTASCQRVRAV